MKQSVGVVPALCEPALVSKYSNNNNNNAQNRRRQACAQKSGQDKMMQIMCADRTLVYVKKPSRNQKNIEHRMRCPFLGAHIPCLINAV